MAVIQDIKKPSNLKKRSLKLSKPLIFKILLFVSVILLVGFVGWLFNRQNSVSQRNSADVEVIKQVVSNHMLLPDEDPVFATVTDTNKINTDFLKKAKNGDKVLIYAEAKRVIIYRPSIDKIVDVGITSFSPKSDNNE